MKPEPKLNPCRCGARVEVKFIRAKMPFFQIACPDCGASESRVLYRTSRAADKKVLNDLIKAWNRWAKVR